MLYDNIILMGDSYKYSMFNQYPPNTEYVFSYVESRGGPYDRSLFFGLQIFIHRYLSKAITEADIDEAEEIILAHGLPFYREGWMHILTAHGGYLPLEIRAVREGTLVPVGNVLATVVNTDPKCFWLTTFVETALLRAIWYPTTVATYSYECKQVIKEYLEKTGDVSGLPFKLHDFGYRGVSSEESAGIGGLAHLVNFMGTDTIVALRYAREYYGEPMAGYSIPAMEHSTVTSWGKDHEIDAFRNMIQKNAKPGGLVACVSDSYDIYNACEKWGTELKDDVLASGATVVIRPDSGDPARIVRGCIQILALHFGYTLNTKGYKVLNNVRVIQGDGINLQTIEEILDILEMDGWSADNVAFGMGGALLQHCNRDTMKFAMKCSAIGVRVPDYLPENALKVYPETMIEWRDVFKDPVTDPGKKSKKGKISLYRNEKGVYSTFQQDSVPAGFTDALQIVFRDGEMTEDTLDVIRIRANQ